MLGVRRSKAYIGAVARVAATVVTAGGVIGLSTLSPTSQLSANSSNVSGSLAIPASQPIGSVHKISPTSVESSTTSGSSPQSLVISKPVITEDKSLAGGTESGVGTTSNLAQGGGTTSGPLSCSGGAIYNLGSSGGTVYQLSTDGANAGTNSSIGYSFGPDS